MPPQTGFVQRFEGVTMSPKERGGLQTRLFRMGLLVFLVITLMLASFLSRSLYVESEDETGTRFFTIAMTVTYENRNGQGLEWRFTDEDRALGLFMNNGWQSAYLVNFSYPIERFETDVDGNPTAFVSFPRKAIGAGEALSYEIAYGVMVKPRSVPDLAENASGTIDDISADLKSLYCSNEGPWQVQDSRLQRLAHEIAGNETKVLTVITRFIVWIKEHVSYMTADGPRYPSETVLEGLGDCDDQANVLVAFCRIVGIPAHLQIGCIYIPTKYSETSYWNGSLISKLSRLAWHGWAVVYVPPWGWLPVDLTYVQGDPRTNPFDAITGSAVVALPTVQYANVTRSDYVAASRARRDYVVTNGFRITEHDVMDEEAVEKGQAQADMDPQFAILAFFLALAILCPLRLEADLVTIKWSLLLLNVYKQKVI